MKLYIYILCHVLDDTWADLATVTGAFSGDALLMFKPNTTVLNNHGIVKLSAEQQQVTIGRRKRAASGRELIPIKSSKLSKCLTIDLISLLT